MEIYFDNSATTRPYDEVASAVFDTMSNNYGNPSSLHKLGIEAERAVKTAKERVAAGIKANHLKFYSHREEPNLIISHCSERPLQTAEDT